MAIIGSVGVLAERRKAVSPWADHVWAVTGVVIDSPARPPWTELRRESQSVLYFAGTADLEVHTSATGNYRDNLATGAPRLWVVLRPSGEEPGMTLALVTPDPDEGEAMTEIGDLMVEAVPMPREIADRLAAFVTEHHVERPFIKRSRT